MPETANIFPEVTTINTLITKKEDVLNHLKSISNLTEDEKQWLTDTYNQALGELNAKTDDEKNKVIGNMSNLITTLRDKITQEKNDKDELKDETIDSETEIQNQILDIENETKWRLEDFKNSLESELVSNTSTNAPNGTVEQTPSEVISEVSEFFQKPAGTSLSTEVEGPKSFISKMLLELATTLKDTPFIGAFLAPMIAKIEWYGDGGLETKQIAEEACNAINKHASNFKVTKVSDKVALVIKMQEIWLPIIHTDGESKTSYATQIIDYIFTGKIEHLEALPHDTNTDMIKAVRGKFLTDKDDETLKNKEPISKLLWLFDINESNKDSMIAICDEAGKVTENEEIVEEVIAPTPAEIQVNTENEALSTKISWVDTSIDELSKIIWTEGQNTLTKDTIIKNSEIIHDIDLKLAEIETESTNSDSMKTEYTTVKDKFQKITEKYRFSGVKEITTDYNERIIPWDLAVYDESLNDIQFKKLIAVSPTQDVAYFYVENFKAANNNTENWVSGYMRVILSEDDPYYHDTGAAFFESADLGENAYSKIKHMESSVSNDNFATLEREWSGTLWDSNVDWKQDTEWEKKIIHLGLKTTNEVDSGSDYS